jgi:hypothetical protein
MRHLLVAVLFLLLGTPVYAAPISPVNVLDYGAVGDGTHDDTAAIRKALNAVPSHGALYLPAGSYLVDTTTTGAYAGGTIHYAFAMKSNLTVFGNRAVMKAKSSTTARAPIETAIFYSNQHLTDVTIRDVTFDMNGANNSVRGLNLVQAAIMFSGDGGRCDDCLIEHNQFLNSVGSSVLVMSQSNTSGAPMGQRNTVRDNYFFHTNAYLTVTDHSTIYCRVDDSVFDNNTFVFSSIRTDSIGVAMDCQGKNLRFTKNLVKNYATGIQIAGSYTSPSSNIVIADNVFAPMRLGGVNFWKEVVSQPIARVTIVGNFVELQDTIVAEPQKYGVQIVTKYSLGDVLIQGNTVVYTGKANPAAWYSRGVVVSPTLAGQRFDNIHIIGNSFLNLYQGAYVVLPSKVGAIGTVSFIGNTVRNNARVGPDLSMGFGAYATDTTTIDQVIVKTNVFERDRAALGTYDYGVWVGGTPGATYGRIEVDGNSFIGLATAGPMPWLSYIEAGVVSARTQRLGSDLLYRKGPPSAPSDGTWMRGQRILNSAPAVGQPKAWTCTGTGNPGAWVSEGNL